MSRIWLVFVILISTNLFGQKLLTLDEAIKIALQRNSNLIKSKNSLQVDKANIKSAYGDLLPDLGIRGTWGWQRVNDAGGQQIDYLGNPIETPQTQTDTRNFSLSAGGNVVLFDGLANYSRISQAENNLESAEFSLEKLKQDIIYTTTSLYYLIISSEELVRVREDNVKFNQKLLEQIQERNKLGSIPIADVYTQQVSVGNAQLLLIQAQNDWETAKNNFLNYLALDIFENYSMVDPYNSTNIGEEETLFKDFSNIESMVDDALNSRADLKSMKLNLSAAEKGETIAQSGLLPSLSGNYSYSTSATKPNLLFDRETYNVGLTLSLPIFSNWSTEANMQLAEVNKLNIQEDILALERTIKIEVKESYLNLVASKKQLEVTNSNIIAAKENRKVNNERYNLGSGTILDVLQSDKDYTQALRDNISAKFQYYQNRDKLMNALGKLEIEKYN
ncbi:MAG: TolC family protein [Ignavibacteriales bacterium]|nr:TolC family protein [Ignavibacteriales bacterium]MBK7979060.1 TolC family protein [Ignavibacteriota bacterium]